LLDRVLIWQRQADYLQSPLPPAVDPFWRLHFAAAEQTLIKSGFSPGDLGAAERIAFESHDLFGELLAETHLRRGLRALSAFQGQSQFMLGNARSELLLPELN
jgi:hypothetical protein